MCVCVCGGDEISGVEVEGQTLRDALHSINLRLQFQRIVYLKSSNLKATKLYKNLMPSGSYWFVSFFKTKIKKARRIIGQVKKRVKKDRRTNIIATNCN